MGKYKKERKGKGLVVQLCLTLCDPMDCSLPGSSVHGIVQIRISSGLHALLQGIFTTQGSNLGLPQWRQIPYHQSHQGRTNIQRARYKIFY